MPFAKKPTVQWVLDSRFSVFCRVSRAQWETCASKLGGWPQFSSLEVYMPLLRLMYILLSGLVPLQTFIPTPTVRKNTLRFLSFYFFWVDSHTSLFEETRTLTFCRMFA